MLPVDVYCEHCRRFDHHNEGCVEVQLLQAHKMLEDVIASGIIIGYTTQPYCRFCSAKGHWTDSGPVIVGHNDDCITARYAKYLEEWQ